MRTTLGRLNVSLSCLLVIMAMMTTHAGADTNSIPFTVGLGFVVTGYSSSQPFSKPLGVFYDRYDKQIYVADTGNGQIAIFDSNGMPVARLPHIIKDTSRGGNAQISEPRSLVVRENGDILIVDNMCQYVDVLDFSGHSVQKLWPGDLLGVARADVRPGCIAMDKSGDIYLSVSGSVNSILVLTPTLRLKKRIAIAAQSGKAMRTITGLWIDGHSNIYATFSTGTCVQVYSPDGQMLYSFGSHDSGENNFSLPSGVTTDARGDVWVVDTLRHAVTAFFPTTTDSGIEAKFLRAIGGFGTNQGEFIYPTAITGDGTNHIYVLEGTGGRLQSFDINFNNQH